MIFVLLGELLTRIERMRESISMERLHHKINQPFRQKTDDLLKNVKFQINSILQSDDRFLPLTGPNFFSEYRSICDNLNEIEYHRVQVIRKFGNTELYFSDLIKLLTQQQFKVNIASIMVTAIRSNKEYFWADIGYELIGIPSGEEWYLTSLPDLAHEIGHFILAYDSKNKWITGNIEKEISNFYSKERQEVEDNSRRPQILLELLPEWEENWKNKWLVEFASDMLAIYFVGPAYAWTNLKIASSELPEDVYSTKLRAHPSHEARMRGINEMLYMLDMRSSVEPIKDAWDRLLALPTYKRPDNYDFAFPDSLLSILANNIYNGCKLAGYLSYPEQLETIENPLSKIMNEAWHVLSNSPAEYQEWEKDQIGVLHKHFNFTGS